MTQARPDRAFAIVRGLEFLSIDDFVARNRIDALPEPSATHIAPAKYKGVARVKRELSESVHGGRSGPACFRARSRFARSNRRERAARRAARHRSRAPISNVKSAGPPSD
jgi:hypothetical protein